MTTVAASAYPRNDIRSIFNTTNSSSSSSSSSQKQTSIVAAAPIKETKPPAKKVEKKTEIDYLCDAYCKIIKNSDSVDKVKEMLHRIVEQFKIRPKKLYRYFHYIKYNYGKV